MANFRTATRAKERLSKQLLKQPDIHAVGVGYYHPGKPSRGAAVIVYTGVMTSTVARKTRTKAKFRPKAKHTMRVNGKKVTVPIRYIRTPKFCSHALTTPYQRRIRPVPAGYSIGTAVASGTAGLIVTKLPNSLYVLSNNHVLNKNNSASLTINTQPGGADGGTVQSDTIGRLNRFVKLRKNGVNYLDAALSVPIRRALLTPRYAKFGALPGHVTSYRIGERFKKIGRTTGLVYGTVESVNTDVSVAYDDFGGLGDIQFKNQSVIRGTKPVSLAGDSGSVWLRSRDNYAAAVNYAGSDDGKLSISFPLQWAVQTFGIQVARPLGKGSAITKSVPAIGPRYAQPLTANQLSQIRVIRAR